MELRSQDSDLRARLLAPVLEAMLRICRSAGCVETGGILVGYYTQDLDCAIITRVSAVPKDSRHAAAVFVRGTAGLRPWLRRLWERKRREYYLGEWHFHPMASPYPSPRDISETRRNAKDPKRNCSVPLLVIIGGDPRKGCILKAFVYAKRGLVELMDDRSQQSTN